MHYSGPGRDKGEKLVLGRVVFSRITQAWKQPRLPAENEKPLGANS